LEIDFFKIKKYMAKENCSIVCLPRKMYVNYFLKKRHVYLSLSPYNWKKNKMIDGVFGPTYPKDVKI
jgi:hypothetical protein